MRQFRSRGWTLVLLMIAGSAGLLANLDAIKAEKNLTKRSRLALENAEKRLDVARAAYLKGEGAAVDAALTEIAASVDLSYESLRETGRKPRKISRHYKRAEIGTRKLLRRMDTFRNEMSYLEREHIEKVMKTVQQVHDNLLLDVMGREH